jgi:hypothetical protein
MRLMFSPRARQRMGWVSRSVAGWLRGAVYASVRFTAMAVVGVVAVWALVLLFG